MVMVFAMLSSLVQLNAPNEMRGRVMSIYMVAFRGGMPLGSLMPEAGSPLSPLLHWCSSSTGPVERCGGMVPAQQPRCEGAVKARASCDPIRRNRCGSLLEFPVLSEDCSDEEDDGNDDVPHDGRHLEQSKFRSIARRERGRVEESWPSAAILLG